MAIVNKYVNANVAADKLGSAHLTEGAKTVFMAQTFEVAAADDNNSVYRVFKAINADLIPVRFEVYNDAITNGTDFDLGVYKTSVGGVNGAVKAQDVFASTLDMSSASGRGSPKDGLENVVIETIERIYEAAGDTQVNKEVGYDIAFTAPAVGTIAGTITIYAWFVQG